MRSKLFTTVLGLVIVGSFAYFTFSEAAHIKQHLQKQHTQMKSLKTESATLDKKLVETKAVKEKTAKEVQQLEQQSKATLSERQKLESELGAN